MIAFLTAVLPGSSRRFFVAAFAVLGLSILAVEPVAATGRGDLNEDGVIDSSDVDFLSDWFFYASPAPSRECLADINGDATTTGLDAFSLIDYVFSNGLGPVQMAEVCNQGDDDCNGVVDDGAFADNREPNDLCSNFSTLPTVGTNQTLQVTNVTIFPSGDVDRFRIHFTETDSTCGCCDLFCTDEDFRIAITLTAPPSSSYTFCVNTSCADTGACQTVQPGQSYTFTNDRDGACGTSFGDNYTYYIRITGSGSCEPYRLSYNLQPTCM